jgi:glycosyltransferase involved in cell wall biosynthesis
LNKTTKPKVSVIIPVYNVERYLMDCVNSVLGQDYENLEVILVDDGSTDKSGEICDEYADLDSRVKVFHEKNNGAATARNIGLDNATGEYVMFLDSDDFWMDFCLERIIQRFKEKNVEVMFLKCAKVKQDGSLAESKGYDFEYCNRKQLLEYISTQSKVAVSACLKVFKRDLFRDKELYFQASLLAEDIDWFFNLVNKANSYTTYDGDFYCYRVVQNSASRSTNEKRIADYLYILNKWSKYASNNVIDHHEKEYYYYMIGYEYEILLSTFYNYSKKIRDKYFDELKSLYWIMQYRNGGRSRLIKNLNTVIGFNNVCRLLNYYLRKRKIK